MKRFLTAILAVILVLSMALPSMAAGTAAEKENKIVYEDGSYLVVTIESDSSLARGTKTQNKKYEYYDANDVRQWRIVLVASFTYDGTTSSCIAAGCNADVYTDNWTVISESDSRSGNVAYGYATLGKISAGIITDRPSYTLTLTCDKNGNIS